MKAPSSTAPRRRAAKEKPAVYYGRSYIADQLGVSATRIEAWETRLSDTDRPFPQPDVIVKARFTSADLGTDSRGRQLHSPTVQGWSEESLQVIRDWRAGQVVSRPATKPAVYYGPGAIARQFGRAAAIVVQWMNRWGPGTEHPFPAADVLIKSSGRDYPGWSEEAVITTIPAWESGRDGVIAQRRAKAREKKARAAELTVEGRIRAAYRAVASEPLQWVRLADIRSGLTDVPREEQDVVLKAMSKVRSAHLVPAVQLGIGDEEAALEIRGVPNHLIVVFS